MDKAENVRQKEWDAAENKYHAYLKKYGEHLYVVPDFKAANEKKQKA
jgi:hypothetical protein